jgi:guanine nucleotide-binding protein subunit alpha
LGGVGAGESGKSTVLKQMRLIHAGGFNKQERKNWRSVIFNNLINAFQIILGAMEEQRTEFEDEANVRWAQYVGSDPEISPEEQVPIDSLHAFMSLWQDKGVQMAMLKGNEYALHDNLE